MNSNMNFNEVIKAVLSPVLGEYGFSVSDERKGRILFSRDAFSISATYDYGFSKDFSLAIYYQLSTNEELCIEDHELVPILGITSQKKKSASEEEEINDFSQFYADLFRKYGEHLFTKREILDVWNKTTLRIII